MPPKVNDLPRLTTERLSLMRACDAQVYYQEPSYAMFVSSSDSSLME
jgi:hypothetical protein